MSTYLAEQAPLGHDKGLPFHEGTPVVYNSPKPSPWLWVQGVILCMQSLK